LYLPAILHNLELTKNGNQGVGPVIAILTPTSSKVKAIASMCLGFEKDLSIVQAYGMVSSKIDLMNGCDVLVATPPAFCRLIEDTKIQFIDRNRIKTLFFDGFDVLIEKFHSEVGKVLKNCTSINTLIDVNPQIIATSSVWKKEIDSIIKKRVPPENLVICIENCFEAAIQARCSILLEISSDFKDKFLKVSEHLKTNSYKTARTVIVTEDDENFGAIINALKKTNIRFTAAVAPKTKIDWLAETRGNFSVLVTTDLELTQMEISNVQELIHFSLPKGWGTFTKRFSCLLDEVYSYSREEKCSSSKFSSRIFLNDTNLNEFVQIIRFMETRNFLNDSKKFLPIVKVRLLLDYGKLSLTLSL
jgi:superfamily II DNA/RNA helicase